MDRRLQVMTNVAFLVLLLLGIALAGKMLYVPVPPPPPPPRSLAIYQPGELIAIAGVDFAAAAQTLVLVTQQGCRFCDASMPFYKQLGDDESLRPRTRIVLVAPDAEPSSQQELAKYGVRVDAVVQAPLGALKVRGTPTAVVVDRQGIVRKVMSGRLDEIRQQELLAALRVAG